MSKELWILFLTLQCLYDIPITDAECHKKFRDYKDHLGTKSAYRPTTKPPPIPAQCQFERIWLMVRHGTRAPSGKVIERMKKRLPKLRDVILQSTQSDTVGLCEDDLVALRTWRPRLKKQQEKTLSATGEDEMIQLAENFQSYFPDLFPGNYSASWYQFRYTATQRTAASARAFAIGLFGRRMSHLVHYPPAVKKHPVLRFYKLCKRWREEIHDNPEVLEERRLFEAGPEMKKTRASIGKRLGLDDLSQDDVKLMYVTCAFESALYLWERSPWCAAFSEENLRVMEFAEDLEYYWVDGYGHNITYEQACPAIRDIALRLIPGIVRPGTPPTTLYFTHSGALLKMLSRLGLYRDSGRLTHDRYHSLHSRLWKVSNIDTFGSNLAFVLSRCNDDWYVLTLHQERVVRLPGCDPGQDLCPLNLFLTTLWDIIADCNFAKLCFS